LGLLTPDQLEALADAAEAHGGRELRTTREQNIAVVGVAHDRTAALIAAVRALGLQVQDKAGDEVDLISCPGTTTCRIGITNSQDFGRELIETVKKYTADPAARRDLRVRISGCQNGCGLHHVGDFGFRGMGKKLDGVNAPHYQIYIGGNDREVGAIGLSGPIVPARKARRALELLLDGYTRDKQPDETVRSWAERVGKDAMSGYLTPLETEEAEGDRFVDWGKAEEFTTPANNKAECATAISDDALYLDLADDGLITLDRALLAGRIEMALDAGRTGILYGARRLVNYLGQPTTEDDAPVQIYAWVRQSFFDNEAVVDAFEAVLEAADTAAAQRNGSVDKFRERLAVFLDVVDATVTKPLDNGGLVHMGALEDGGDSLAAILAKQGS
jgi:sulfite reductase (NADPH) hemoprotein beta-component